MSQNINPQRGVRTSPPIAGDIQPCWLQSFLIGKPRNEKGTDVDRSIGGTTEGVCGQANESQSDFMLARSRRRTSPL